MNEKKQLQGNAGSRTISCPACRKISSSIFFELPQQPVLTGNLWESGDKAIDCNKGDISLAYCDNCGFIHNASFDPDKLHYSQEYDNSLHFSPTYQAYAEENALRLVQRYGLKDKTVLEIGCGKGDFLMSLCKLGPNTGIGFDVSYRPREMDAELSGRLTFINDMYGEKYSHLASDLICSRNVLEHIPEPAEFLSKFRRSLSLTGNPVIYCEVPNVDMILTRLSVWDIIYEHCSYFSRASLALLFSTAWFRVIEEGDGFDNQFIWLDAVPVHENSNNNLNRRAELDSLSMAVAAFGGRMDCELSKWHTTLSCLEKEGKTVVVWGGGARTVSFLNMLGVGNQVSCVVDINPAKQGKYIPGTGHKIVAPDDIRDLNPDTVVLLNPVYRLEIGKTLRALGLAPEILLTDSEYK